MKFFQFQARQSDYEDLQKRLDEFEAKERLEKLENDIKSSPNKFSPEVQAKIDVYLENLKSFQKLETLIRQIKVKKNNLEHALDRVQSLNPDDDLEDLKISKSKKDMENKIKRLRRKQENIKKCMEPLENELPMENDDLQIQIDKVKDTLQLEHALKVTEIMFHEQSQTERLLNEALNQLKNFYRFTYTSLDTDMKQSFKVCCSILN